jgi:hypothetical protein
MAVRRSDVAEVTGHQLTALLASNCRENSTLEGCCCCCCVVVVVVVVAAAGCACVWKKEREAQ